MCACLLCVRVCCVCVFVVYACLLCVRVCCMCVFVVCVCVLYCVFSSAYGVCEIFVPVHFCVLSCVFCLCMRMHQNLCASISFRDVR